MASNRITTLPRKLKALTNDAVPGIRAIYTAAVNAQIPAYQVNRIWHFRDEDVPAIMACFGLQPKAGMFASAHHAAVEHAA